MRVGFVIPEWKVQSVPESSMKVLAAILRDPNPVHWDRNELEAKGLGNRLINQGPINFCYVTNMLQIWAGVQNLKKIKAQFTANVFENERVIAQGVVTAIEVCPDSRVLATCDIWLLKEDGSRAVEGTALVDVSEIL